MADELKPCPFDDHRVMPEPMSGCWLWIGARQSRGYGHLSFEGKPVLAHRWSYEQTIGPIPDGLTLDHRCRNRACINPAHLRPMTQRENNAISESSAEPATSYKNATAGENMSTDKTRAAEPRGDPAKWKEAAESWEGAANQWQQAANTWEANSKQRDELLREALFFAEAVSKITALTEVIPVKIAAKLFLERARAAGVK